MTESTVQRVQRKVAVFVTRRLGEGTEIALTWHAGGGHQLPAGTVEAGESFSAAASREVAEETGLDDVELVGDLGEITVSLPEDRAVLLASVPLRHRPGGPPTPWRLTHVAVELIEQRGDWSLISYGERDIEDPNSLEIARLTGWVPSDRLARTQQRRFFLAVSRDRQTRPWHREGEPGMDFTVAWHPLDRRPTLIPAQEEWLARYSAELAWGI